jgi:hypothetical protein
MGGAALAVGVGVVVAPVVAAPNVAGLVGEGEAAGWERGKGRVRFVRLWFVRMVVWEGLPIDPC